jgi:4-amino-4-deoxy-L-arabinose transferase-like glycosyltransferase
VTLVEDGRCPQISQWGRLIAVGLLAVFFAQMVTAIPRLSLTADEPVYVGAGYAFLRSGDLRMATSAQHPPLMQELVALPLLLGPGPELDALEGWDTAEMARFAPAFVSWYGEALDVATFAARMPVALLALLWAAFLFHWAADWFGPWGGLVALTLFVFDPNILAHATLATNDVGFAAFSFIALFAAMRLLRQRPERSVGLRQRPERSVGLRQRPERSVGLRCPSRRYLLLAGLALGASLSAKASGFFAALVLATLLLLTALPGGEGRTRRIGRAALQLSLIAILGLLVLWASYGFEFRPLVGGRLPVPMATQWEIWRETRRHLDDGTTDDHLLLDKIKILD